jgi:ubiquinol-cytochrome c reductase cytochrome b subunit
MNYKPDSQLAFASVEYIMRDVPFGWLIRYLHSTGASMFFVVVYLHMFRGLLYGSYRKPRELVWVFGCLIFLCLMAEAFFGYLLPWGQMSYWGAQVIVNLFSAIPFIGPDLSLWIRGDYVVSDVTLNRFFAFHVIAIPLVLLALVVAHIMALHEVGSNNPDGVEIKEKKDANGIPLDGVPFHPYYSVHDFLGVTVFLFIFCAIVFFAPEMGGYFLEANNFIPADSLKTPPEIAPVWYFTAFYAMLRSVTEYFKIVLEVVAALLALLGLIKAPSMRGKLASVIGAGVVIGVMLVTQAKFWGVLTMGGAVVTLFFLPWLDKSPVKSIRYRPLFHKILYVIFVFVFLTLAFLGTKPPTPAGTLIAQIGTLIYFCFFWGMPFWTRLGTFKPVPERVTYKPH